MLAPSEWIKTMFSLSTQLRARTLGFRSSATKILLHYFVSSYALGDRRNRPCSEVYNSCIILYMIGLQKGDNRPTSKCSMFSLQSELTARQDCLKAAQIRISLNHTREEEG